MRTLQSAFRFAVDQIDRILYVQLVNVLRFELWRRKTEFVYIAGQLLVELLHEQKKLLDLGEVRKSGGELVV